MFSWEIEKFLKERNYYIGGKDLNFILDTRQHPQINHIKFNPFDNSYEMWSKDGEYFHFTGMPYKEAEVKGLINEKEEDDWER